MPAVDMTLDPLGFSAFERPTQERRINALVDPTLFFDDGILSLNSNKRVLSYSFTPEGRERIYPLPDALDILVSVSTPGISLRIPKVVDGLDNSKQAVTISSRITTISSDLGFNKTFLSQIMGVTRQAVYDWLEGRSSINADNLQKLEWIETLNNHLNQDIKAGLWLWRKRILPQNGKSIEQTIADGKEEATVLANWISQAALGWSNPANSIATSKNKQFKDFLDEAPIPFNDRTC